MECCLTLGNIKRVCGGAATPGLADEIFLGCVDDMICWPSPDEPSQPNAENYVYSGSLFVKSHYSWRFDRKESSYTAEPQGDDGDQGWLVTVNFFIKKLSPATTYILNNTSNGEYWMVVRDKCGNKRFLGDPICGGVSLSIREQTNDKNGYVVTATWATSYLPYYLTECNFVTLPTPVITKQAA